MGIPLSEIQGYSNLLTFRLKENIESAATFGLHEEIARFRPGKLDVSGHCTPLIVAKVRLHLLRRLQKSSTLIYFLQQPMVA